MSCGIGERVHVEGTNHKLKGRIRDDPGTRHRDIVPLLLVHNPLEEGLLRLLPGLPVPLADHGGIVDLVVPPVLVGELVHEYHHGHLTDLQDRCDDAGGLAAGGDRVERVCWPFAREVGGPRVYTVPEIDVDTWVEESQIGDSGQASGAGGYDAHHVLGWLCELLGWSSVHDA